MSSIAEGMQKVRDGVAAARANQAAWRRGRNATLTRDEVLIMVEALLHFGLLDDAQIITTSAHTNPR